MKDEIICILYTFDFLMGRGSWSADKDVSHDVYT
jgi:hypothetical protein